MRRIALFLASLITVFGIVGTTGTALAETPTASVSQQQSNFYMYWGSLGQPGPVMWQDYPNSSSNVYAPTAANPWNWYSCYIADCDGIVADASGVHLLSTTKDNASLATDHQVLGGYYGYSYTDANGATLYYSASWNGQGTLPWTKQFYSADTHQWVTLTLSYANLDLHWNGQPEVPTCDHPTVDAVGFCSMK